MAADTDFLCSYIDRSLNAPRLRSTATVAASSEGRIRMYHVQGNGAPEYALDGCQEADSEARNLYYQGTSGIVWLLPLMGLQTVNSLLAALLNSGEAGCCEPGQSDSGVSLAGICTNGLFQVRCKAGEALRAYHPAGSFEAEDRIQGTCKIPGGQGQAKPFSPVGQVFDEIPDEDFPNSIVVQIVAQELQHR